MVVFFDRVERGKITDPVEATSSQYNYNFHIAASQGFVLVSELWGFRRRWLSLSRGGDLRCCSIDAHLSGRRSSPSTCKPRPWPGRQLLYVSFCCLGWVGGCVLQDSWPSVHAHLCLYCSAHMLCLSCRDAPTVATADGAASTKEGGGTSLADAKA